MERKIIMNSFYSEKELQELGLKKIGKNVLISRKSSLYGCDKISIGDNVRIDDFCVLSGSIILGNYIHIAVYSALFGGSAGIEMKDFSGLSSRCVVYAESDDYSGEMLTNPTIPEKYVGVIRKKVILNKHTIIGSSTTILPGVVIGEGTAVGSMSLVNKSIGDWSIYAGIPCQRIKDRSRNLLQIEEQFMEDKEK